LEVPLPSVVETSVLHPSSSSPLGRGRPAAPPQAADPFAQLLESAEATPDRRVPERAEPGERGRTEEGRDAETPAPRVTAPAKKEKAKSAKDEGKTDMAEAAPPAPETATEAKELPSESSEDVSSPAAVAWSDAEADPLLLPTEILAAETANLLPVPTAVVAALIPVVSLVSNQIAPVAETGEIAAITTPAAAAAVSAEEPAVTAAPLPPVATPVIAAEVSTTAETADSAPAKPQFEAEVAELKTDGKAAKAEGEAKVLGPVARSETPADPVASAFARNSQASPQSAEAKPSTVPSDNAAKPHAAAEHRPEQAITGVDVESNPARAAAEPAANVPAPPPTAVPGPALAVAHIVPAPVIPGGPAIAVPVEGLAVEIAARAQSGKNHFQIRLDPPELGRIDVRLDVDREGNVTSRLTVDRVETLDLLRRDASNLERALQQAGLKTSDNGLQFSLRDQSFSHRDQPGETPAMARVIIPEDLITLETQPGYGRLAALGRVDIRV
jgi:flagellar hook-length control protein FliK